MSFEITWIDNNPIVIFRGIVDFNVINNANMRIVGDPRFDDMKYQIFEYCNVEKILITEEEAQTLGVLDKSATIWNREVKVALVFKDKTILKPANKYAEEMKDSGWEVQTFHDIEKVHMSGAQKNCY